MTMGDKGRVDLVYLDYAATAPIRTEVLEAMRGLAQTAWANPNSLYTQGRTAFRRLEISRSQIARALGARNASEVVLTSGGTESDNAALAGITARVMDHRRGRQAHVVVAAFEHHAVLAAAARLKRIGHKVTYVQPRRDGFIWPEDLEAVMCDDTVLVSIMAANNEVGTVQPVAELARIAHSHGALLHADCVQMLGKLPLSLEESGVDAASFSGHKLGGPRRCGILYLRRTTPFASFVVGGGQEEGRRSGTQDALGAAGLARAVELASAEACEDASRLARLRDFLLAGLIEAGGGRVRPVCDMGCAGPCDTGGVPLAGCGIAGAGAHLPNIATVTVEGMESGTLLMRLDASGIAASGGSACSSHSLDPSHVLSALGIPRRLALGELRFSLGHATTEQDIGRALSAFSAALR